MRPAAAKWHKIGKEECRMAKRTKSERVPAEMRSKFEAIVSITDAFCSEILNDEYALLARQAAAALSRKRPSPLERGAAKTWACGIVYALGFVNFLFDKSQDLYISAADLCAHFGVAKSTGYAKSKVVRDALDMVQMDPNWYLPSRMDENILAWTITVNGFLVDARRMPREVQEIAYRKGLIPYIPGESE
jgi:hypothetical protein